MIAISQLQPMTRSNVVEVLTTFRQLWEEATAGESLVNVKVSFGLVLFDIVIALALRPSEQVQVLGPTLQAELQNFLVVMPESVVLEQ